MKWFVVESGVCYAFEHAEDAAKYIAERINKHAFKHGDFCVFRGERYSPEVKASVLLAQWKP